MDAVLGLFQGFAVACTPENLFVCLLGAILGTVTGVLPGIGPTAAMALLIPVSFGLTPTAAMILLAGVYYGAMYGGSTTSILLNMPGEAASVVTCIDGYQLAKKGRAGAALAVAAIGSWIAGTLAVVGVMLFAPPLANMALKFGPPEYFAISFLGLILLTNLSDESALKAVVMAVIGLMLSTIGIDLMSGRTRYTFGFKQLLDGIDLVPVLMGLFGLSEVLQTIMEKEEDKEVFKFKFRDLYPTRREMKRALPSIFRGTLLGFPIGLLPGPSGTLSSFAAYKLEKYACRKNPEFGHGAIEGVAGPEAANNSASTASLIPLFSLGLPFAPPVAILLSGLMIHGVNPGPSFVTQHADIFWGVIASMYLGNVMLLVLNLPMVSVFASLIKTPSKILMPIITAIMFVGAYCSSGQIFDVFILLIFGILGLLFKKYRFDLAPLIVGLVLGNTFEESLRQGLGIVKGDIGRFVSRPITGIILALALVVLAWNIIKNIRNKKAQGGK